MTNTLIRDEMDESVCKYVVKFVKIQIRLHVLGYLRIESVMLAPLIRKIDKMASVGRGLR